jgi:hypothetical protein
MVVVMMVMMMMMVLVVLVDVSRALSGIRALSRQHMSRSPRTRLLSITQHSIA